MLSVRGPDQKRTKQGERETTYRESERVLLSPFVPKIQSHPGEVEDEKENKNENLTKNLPTANNNNNNSNTK